MNSSNPIPIRLFIVVILLLGTASANYALSRPEAEQKRRSLTEFPKRIGDWTLAGEQSIGESSMAVLQVDDYIMRTYRDGRGHSVGLYIGYFKNQREGKQVHSPRLCLPGAGYKIVHHEEIMISPRGFANLHIMAKDDLKTSFIWWTEGRGRMIANEYLSKMYMVWDSITKRRTDGGLVRVDMIVRTDLAATLEIQRRFIDAFLPVLKEYFPGG